MVQIRRKLPSGHKPNWAKRRQRERFNLRHPEGRKEFARQKRLRRLAKRIAKRQRYLERKKLRFLETA